MFWYNKKKRIEEAHKKIDDIYSHFSQELYQLKTDILNLHKWIVHFKDSHESHRLSFAEVNRRINLLEDQIDSKIYELESLRANDLPFADMPKTTVWDSLTETQKMICWKLAALQKETPNQWISQKYLAQEVYPNKPYDKVRSVLSQYISSLEAMGLIIRTRKGKQSYVISTNKNPALNKKLRFLVQTKE